MAVPALPRAGHRPSGLPLVPLKSSCLTVQAGQGGKTASTLIPSAPQAVIAPAPGPLAVLQPRTEGET